MKEEKKGSYIIKQGRIWCTNYIKTENILMNDNVGDTMYNTKLWHD